ncbi:hypothetical protein TBK1r_02940 [Stieleria magnilauensis]|uniref:Uncharacterized protein n=1 Tax=Stieleria magnilauensis TaxID=2527963 RepID=A0ABX5XHM7_9BACT|nr:hypothetical protein TBK1r_02940 [Planctomycetes bacterium TBK1r]
MNNDSINRPSLFARLRNCWWLWPLIIITLVLSIPWFVLTVLLILWLFIELVSTAFAVRQLMMTPA